MGTVFKGQTFPGYISPANAPGLTEGIRWTFRGMWPELRTKFLTDIEQLASSEEKETLMLSYMEQMIVEWDLKYDPKHPDKQKAGKVVPIKADVIKTDVMLHIRNRIFAISTWQTHSDIDPKTSNKQQVTQVQQKVSGKSPAELFADIDRELVGNSEGPQE